MGLLESTRLFIWCQILACSFFILLFGWHIHQGDHLTALVYFGGSVVITLSFFITHKPVKNRLQFLSHFVFAGYTLVSLLLLLVFPQKNSYLHLSLYLAYPLLAFYLLPFKVALLFVMGFSLSANLLLMLQLEGTLRAVYALTFWLVILLTSLNRFAYFTRQELLKKQLNRDPKTQLMNQQQFLIDLKKEQERAQREATFLGVISLISKDSFNLNSVKALTSHFAPYESMYSVAANKLVVLVPLANPKDLQARQKKLAHHLPHLTLNSQLAGVEKHPVNYLKATPDKFRPAT